MSLNKLEQCFNRSCGKKYNPDDNKDDSCQHHPGNPYFHDAYKIWSCCNKKSIDFTEFLNIKGCTKSKHSNIKPEEPSKPAVDRSKSNKVIEVNPKSLKNALSLKRPSFEITQITLTPIVSSVLLEQVKNLVSSDDSSKDENVVKTGQSCKNNSCKGNYQGPQSNLEICKFHPGTPIFHEGMKYWSCCQKKTTEFSAFLEQPGCRDGNHVWLQKDSKKKKAKCRLDWHQTTTHVYVSVFAKKYDPNSSFIKLNPIRLTMEINLPEEDSKYNLDIELQGMINVQESSVNMFPTKVEVKLRKQEAGSWAKLEIPRDNNVDVPANNKDESDISNKVDAVDLSDL